MLQLFALFAILGVALDGQNFACSFPPSDLAEGRKADLRDEYWNGALQYSARIPPGMAGHVLPGSDLPQHGFDLVIGTSRTSYIVVWAEANSFASTSAIDEAIRSMRYLRDARVNIESVDIKQSQLGTLPAVRLVVTYSCSPGKDRFIMDSTIALKRAVYSVTLYTHSTQFDKASASLQFILKSWKYIDQR